MRFMIDWLIVGHSILRANISQLIGSGWWAFKCPRSERAADCVYVNHKTIVNFHLNVVWRPNKTMGKYLCAFRFINNKREINIKITSKRLWDFHALAASDSIAWWHRDRLLGVGDELCAHSDREREEIGNNITSIYHFIDFFFRFFTPSCIIHGRLTRSIFYFYLPQTLTLISFHLTVFFIFVGSLFAGKLFVQF